MAKGRLKVDSREKMAPIWSIVQVLNIKGSMFWDVKISRKK